tara:strand:- start:210 stop:1154 length:945 start_codon:yes stop_codon:yes gene_type:complete
MTNKVLLIFFLFAISSPSLSKDINTECKEFIKNSEISENNANQKEKLLFEKGVLWKVITPKNKINYLYGTMHSQDYLVSKYPHEVKHVLVSSKKLILEVIPDNISNSVYIDRMYYKNSKRLDQILDGVFFERLKQQLDSYNLSENQIKKIKYLKPWAAFNLIGRPKPVRAPSLESNLFRLAKERGLIVESLESMDNIISSLEKINEADQINILKDTICNRKEIIRDIKKLVNLYVNRDIVGIRAFNDIKHSNKRFYDQFMQIMLDDRNKKMLKTIKEEFEFGDVFVAVGISHLIANNSLLELLNGQGYKLEVIY